MSMLVVGKGGTLGRLLSERLQASAIEVRAADPRDVEPIDAVTRASVVVNAGGPRVRKGLGWSDYFREHVGVTTRVLRSMRPGSHLVHLSSTAVFGARGAPLGVTDAPAPTLFPSAPYACAKLAAELAARAEAADRGVALTVLRPSMVYGPGVDSALESIRKLAQRGVALRLSPASVRQHLTHVDLLVEAIARAGAGRPPERPRVLVVADPFVLVNRDVWPSRGVPLPLPLGPASHVRSLGVPGAGPALEALEVLAMDNVFEWQPLFDELGLDVVRHCRERSFDPYWRE